MTRLVAAGLNFRTAPLAVREAAVVPAEQARVLLRYLVGHAGVSGAAVMSTCNRTEIYVTCGDDDAGSVIERLAPHLDPGDRHDLPRHLVSWTDRAAVEHLFRVACGLESMVLGEVQVLGQVREAHALARGAETLDARLDFVLRRAISVAKLVHTQTRFGRGAGSLSEVAVACARDVVGSLRGSGALVIGAGAMGTLAARRLHELGATVMVTSRGASKDEVAARIHARAVPLDSLVQHADEIDVIVCASGSEGVVLDVQTVRAMQQLRGVRPLCIVDIAVPHDVDRAVASLDGVTLLDIDSVGARLDSHMSKRRSTIPEVEAIVARELERTMTVIGQRDAASPTIAALVRRAEQLRRREVERAVAAAPLDPDVRERIDLLTASLVRKLLHGPITHLRESAGDPAVALTLRQAFDLDDAEVAARADLTRVSVHADTTQ